MARTVIMGAMHRRWLLASLAVALAACAPAPWRAGVPSVWHPSPNFDERRPVFVIIHHTSDDTAEQALRVLADRGREVSAHYLVARDGTIYQLVDERARAWHAGVSRWGAQTDINSASLGIELDNNGAEPFPEAQIAALMALLADIEARYRIPAANFLGHGDVAPGRKVDPGRLFPWRTLAAHGFGLWCDAPLPETPPGFETLRALQAFGYDISDPEAAARAFNRHFLQDDASSVIGPEGQALLACLVEKAGRGGG